MDEGQSPDFNLLVNLIAYLIVKDKTLAEGAPVLRRLGLEPAKIAHIMGSTPNAVSVAIAKSKKAGNAKEE